MKKILTLCLLTLCGGLVTVGANKSVTQVKAEDEIVRKDYEFQVKSVYIAKGGNSTNNPEKRYYLSVCIDPKEYSNSSEWYNWASNITDVMNSTYTQSLNWWQGYILVDGKPLELWSNQNHRTYYQIRSDGRVDIKFDVSITTAITSVTFKKGCEMPTPGFAKGTSGAVMVVRDECTLSVTKKTDVTGIPAAGSEPFTNFTYKYSYDTANAKKKYTSLKGLTLERNNANTRYLLGFLYDFGYDGDAAKAAYGYTANDGISGNNLLPANIQRGRVSGLNYYSNILINDQPIVPWNVETTNGRAYMQCVSGNVRFAIDIKYDFDQILKIFIPKGTEMPTRAFLNGLSTDYSSSDDVVVTDCDMTYTISPKSGTTAETTGQAFNISLSNQGSHDKTYENVDTTVSRFKLTAQEETTAYCYGDFILSDFDCDRTGSIVCNYGTDIVSDNHCNVFTNVETKTGNETGFLAKETSTRWPRMRFGPNLYGAVIANNVNDGLPYDSITVKAGTRFPSFKNFCTNNNANNTVGYGFKFYTTTEDTVLFRISNTEYVSLKAYQEEKLALLDNYDADNYRSSEQTELATAKTNATTAVMAETTLSGVDTAIASAKAVLDAIKTDAVLTAEELAAEKTSACNELDAYKSVADYRDAEKQTLAKAIADGKTAINACTVIGDVATALADAKTAIDAIKTDAQLTAEELAAAKVTAKNALDSYKSADDYREAEKTSLANAIQTGKDAIDACTVIGDVDTALASAIAAIDAIKTDAQYVAEELEAAKVAAKGELDTYRSSKNNVDYREAQIAELDKALVDGKAAVDNCTVIGDVEGVVAAAKSVMDAVKTDAQMTAAAMEKALVIKNLIAKINEVIAPADKYTVDDNEVTIDALFTMIQSEIDAADAEALSYVDNLAYFQNAKAALPVAKLIAAIGEVALTPVSKAKIDAARTAYDALTNAQKARISVDALTAAEASYAALEAEDLVAYKAEKVAELQAEYDALDLSKYSDENKTVLAEGLESGKGIINAATDKAAVDTALAAAKAALAAVEKMPEDVKKGCFGSITAAAGIISLVSILGVGLIASKKKED